MQSSLNIYIVLETDGSLNTTLLKAFKTLADANTYSEKRDEINGLSYTIVEEVPLYD